MGFSSSFFVIEKREKGNHSQEHRDTLKSSKKHPLGAKATIQRLAHRVILLPNYLNRSVRPERNWLYRTLRQKALMNRVTRSFKVKDTD